MEKTRTCEIFIDEFEILHIKILGGVIIDRADAADNFLVAKYLTKGKPVLKLVDARKIFKIKKEAFAFVEKENDPKKYIAKAILVGSLISRYLNHFFLSQQNAKLPVRIFTSEKEAMEWLKMFL
ncbi:MAG: hypothetical protein V4549_12110 [Bacteroidota bacterium]